MGTERQTTMYMAALFCVLFVTTNFVNKYVLSVLRFTYPTIFQGWQTLVGACVLKSLMVSGHMDPLLKGADRRSLAPWVPGMILFLVSLYSGSRALTNLPVAVFFSLQNTVAVFKAITQLILHKQLLSGWSYLMLMAVLLSALGVSVTDPQFSSEGYFWMCIHVLSNGLFHVYTNLMKGRLKLSALDRLYSCYIYSVVMFAPCSYLLGDVWEAVNYPYLYFTKFYIGCVLSGVLGIFLNVTAIRLQETDFLPSGLDFSAVQAIARICGSLLSLLIFQTVLTANFAFLVAINQLCSVVVMDVVSRGPLPHILPSSSSSSSFSSSLSPHAPRRPTTSSSAPDMRQLERHELQQDMLRIELR
ncbi:UDP-N-acetylglucosamine transporter TMEM241 homolog [Babylonia areolata]|uniref:UDP-N-acetylglucosamine transporter TMEM241 homolog n=1 Tax=Babylonia areolata TaxID=304850 RepID=UPI003FD42FDA